MTITIYLQEKPFVISSTLIRVIDPHNVLSNNCSYNFEYIVFNKLIQVLKSKGDIIDLFKTDNIYDIAKYISLCSFLQLEIQLNQLLSHVVKQIKHKNVIEIGKILS